MVLVAVADRADAEDAILCDLYARHAAHAAMAGKTGVLIGYLHDAFIHVPIAVAVGRVQRVDPEGGLWRAVLAATGQPARFGGSAVPLAGSCAGGHNPPPCR